MKIGFKKITFFLAIPKITEINEITVQAALQVLMYLRTPSCKHLEFTAAMMTLLLVHVDNNSEHELPVRHVKEQHPQYQCSAPGSLLKKCSYQVILCTCPAAAFNSNQPFL